LGLGGLARLSLWGAACAVWRGAVGAVAEGLGGRSVGGAVELGGEVCAGLVYRLGLASSLRLSVGGRLLAEVFDVGRGWLRARVWFYRWGRPVLVELRGVGKRFRGGIYAGGEVSWGTWRRYIAC